MSDDKDRDNLRPHSYDGIEEYDNQLPRWWLNGFYLSIFFAIGYFAWYQMGDGKSLQAEYEATRNQELAAAKLLSSTRKSKTEDELLALAIDPQVLKIGEQQFQAKCAVCHAADGGGSVGPNLTDDYFIHGNKMSEMIKIIREGVAAKGMPTWGALMSEDEIIGSAAFIKSLHGKAAVVPKAPEGSLIK